jgi:hypothetical protein
MQLRQLQGCKVLQGRQGQAAVSCGPMASDSMSMLRQSSPRAIVCRTCRSNAMAIRGRETGTVIYESDRCLLDAVASSRADKTGLTCYIRHRSIDQCNGSVLDGGGGTSIDAMIAGIRSDDDDIASDRRCPYGPGVCCSGIPRGCMAVMDCLFASRKYVVLRGVDHCLVHDVARAAILTL